MRRIFLDRLGMIGLVLALAAPAAHALDQDGFTQWLQEFETRARSAGISPKVVDESLGNLTLDDSVIELDQKQPENKITLAKYLSNTVNARRINKGRALLEEYRPVLQKISAQYGVQPKFILALWAIESDYGAHKGDFSVVQSLATLAYEGRRRDFFSDELLAALQIIQTEHMAPYDLTGSWAGAMGDCQFMPSTYLKYAVDANHDGHRDIWNSAPDTFASIANYLHALGWQPDRSWGAAATIPASFSESDMSITKARTLPEWRAMGVDVKNVHGLGGPDKPLYLIYSNTADDGAYLVTDNFKALLQWNRSRYFATAVGTLANAIGD